MEIQNSYPITFTGYKSAFSKKLEKALNTPVMTREQAKNLLKDFTDMYDKKVCPDTKIGTGFFGSVYKIDDCYVLKRGNECLVPEFKGISLKKHGKFSHLKHYFGEAVAKIYNNTGEDMLILRNVYSKGNAIAAGLPFEYASTHPKEECLKYYAKNCLIKFAKLPQRSFDGIAKDFAKLNKMCSKHKSFFFDFMNPNNFVLCGKTIRITDEINQYEKTRNCVTDMLDIFLNKIDFDNNAEFDKKLLSLRKELTKKLILAGARHNIPMYYNTADLTAWSKTFNELLGIKNIDVTTITSDIGNIADLYKKPKQRVEKVKQYLETVAGF